jgi:uncharacterized membrane protein (DUF485 family)
MVQPIPRAGALLTALILAAFFGFIVLAAASPATLAAPTIGAIPLSFVLTTALILGTILVTGLYVLAANTKERR